MKQMKVSNIQVVKPLNYESEQGWYELHIELTDEQGETAAVIQRFTKEEWDLIASGRGYWHQ